MDQQAPNYQLWPQAANVYPAVAQLHYHSVPETPYTLTPAPVTTPISSPLFHPPPLPKEQINITEMFPRLSNPGEIGLRVDVVEDKERKNSPYLWMKSELYVQVKERLPVTITSAQPIPSDAVVRAYLVYRGKDGIVKRCLKHMAQDGDIPFVAHWVHAPKTCCPHYQEFMGVHMVDIPFSKLMGEGDTHLALYEFMCYSSCVNQNGSRRRRSKYPPVRLMLQVIHQGRELGRDCLDLRICACPSRDKKKKEKVVDPEENEAVQVPNLEFDQSLPRAKMSKVVIDGREFYDMNFLVPVEDKDTKDCHLSIDIHMRLSLIHI